MKKIIILLPLFLCLSCASTTVITSMPQGAIVKQGNEAKGVTPYEHWDRELSDYSTTFTLSKEGYKDKTITIKKDVLYLHRIIIPPIIGLPWLFGYNPSYFYELEKDELPIKNK